MDNKTRTVSQSYALVPHTSCIVMCLASLIGRMFIPSGGLCLEYTTLHITLQTVVGC